MPLHFWPWQKFLQVHYLAPQINLCLVGASDHGLAGTPVSEFSFVLYIIIDVLNLDQSVSIHIQNDNARVSHHAI